jgi:hypothetical protein
MRKKEQMPDKTIHYKIHHKTYTMYHNIKYCGIEAHFVDIMNSIPDHWDTANYTIWQVI